MKSLLSFALLATTSVVYAIPTTVNPLGENGIGGPTTSVQGIIDARGNTLVTIDSEFDQLVNGLDGGDGWWTATGGMIDVSMVIELAAYSAVNKFGIYNAANPNERTVVFEGSAAAGSQASLLTPYETFGFFFNNPTLGAMWFSDATLNANGSLDHMVAYQGKGEDLLLGPNLLSPTGFASWGSDSVLLGWEGGNLGDSDFQDMLLLVRNVTPFSTFVAISAALPSGENQPPFGVPDAGSTALLLGAALAALALARRSQC